jgi:lipoprotein-anchoring transpeptidase ErfK/SrfK
MTARRQRRPRPAAVGLALLGAVVGVVAAAATARSPDRALTRVAGNELPLPVTPSFRPGPPRALGSARYRSHWATVKRAASARSAAEPGAAVVAGVPTTTPEGTPNAVAVLGQREDGAGRLWVRVRLPALPRGTTGWVRRSALGAYQTIDARLDVDVARLRATLYRHGRAVLRAPVAVGRAGWPTPLGRYYVRNKLTRYRSPAYGPVAFGTSARSPTATGWPAGGFVGIHGTDRPELVPGRVSHGCIRLRNRDVLALARLMPVGTPLTIH